MKIVLVGYMGSGKSSVGKKLASVLNFPFKDLDSEIESSESKTVSDIFTAKGEIYFRKIEIMVLQKLLSNSGSFVLATGGGTPCYGNSMDIILSQNDVVSIYLKTPVEVLTKRLFFEKENRPLLGHLKTENDFNDYIRKHLFERAYYYNQAKVSVDCASENIDAIVKKIVLKLF